VKRLGVLGTLVWDTIRGRRTAAGATEPLEDWGGIAYSLGALSAACPPGWEVVPLLKVGHDLDEEAGRFLRSLANVRLEPGVRVVPHPVNRVELRYWEESRRCERLSGGVPPWRWDEMEPLLEGLDALYINFISGFEMELEVMERLRAAYAGPIFADLHSLFLARGPDGRRSLRPLPEWQRWLRCFDAVQLNEDELRTLAQGDDPWQFAVAALQEGASLIVVTLAGEGAAFVTETTFPADPLRWPEHRGRARRIPAAVRSGRVPSATGPLEGDPTGCGDVWGSTFIVRLLAGATLEAAMGDANTAAGRNVRHRGASGLNAILRDGLHRG
jgi:hypothetical protein